MGGNIKTFASVCQGKDVKVKEEGEPVTVMTDLGEESFAGRRGKSPETDMTLWT
jgi:hypothetical protein